MAKKKQAVKVVEVTVEAAAQIAHAGAREAQLVDHIENNPNDFEVQTWEFLGTRKKADAIARVEALRDGDAKPENLFDTLALIVL